VNRLQCSGEWADSKIAFIWVPPGEGQGLGWCANTGPLVEIEQAIDANHRKWTRARSRAAWGRCFDRRIELLERAVGMPIETNDDGATALRIVLKAPGNEDVWDNPTEDIGKMGMPEDLHCANLMRNVQRFLRREV
jgi:hypothetical protein